MGPTSATRSAYHKSFHAPDAAEGSVKQGDGHCTPSLADILGTCSRYYILCTQQVRESTETTSAAAKPAPAVSAAGVCF